MAKQKLESDRVRHEAEEEKQNKRMILRDLQKSYRELLAENQVLPPHVRLQPQELRLDMRFVEQAERVKRQRIREVQRELAWKDEKSRLALEKLQNWFKYSSVVTVVAIASEHRVSTYCLPSVTERAQDPVRRPSQSSSSSSTSTETRKGRAEPGRGATTITEEEVVLTAPLVPRPPAVKLADRQVERLRKATEKAEQARAKIQKRKEEWAQLYAEKPDENHEDPQDVQAIVAARETVGDLKLKSSPDFTVPKHLRVNAGKKREELSALEEAMRRRQTEMNARIIALRDSKLQLVSHLQTLSTQLQRVQRRLRAESHLPCPALPRLRPEETPERRHQCTRTTLQRYKELRDAWSGVEEQDQDGASDFLQQLWTEMEEGQQTVCQSDTTNSDLEPEGEGLEEKTELEVEVEMEEQVRLLYQQDCVIEQMQSAMCEWDAALRMLLHEKLLLDQELKLADLRKLTMLQELWLLKQFESREDSLQSKLSVKAGEEDAIKLRLEELNEQLESKRQEISKLQEREKALTTAFVSSLGENNKCEEFLTRVFKKKIKRVKKREKTAEEEQQDDSEEEDEDEEWDEDDEDVDEGGSPLDDCVCPPNCDPALFENTLQLRERKLDLKEQLQETRRNAEALQKDCETLAKKEKNVQSSRETVENDLELMHREKQQKMNELDVVVPLRLHQIEFLSDGKLLTDLSQALVLERSVVQRLQDRIPELRREKNQQRELFKQARQQHVRLLQENADMEAHIQVLNKQCDERMMKKFGRVVDLEALQTLSGNRVLEELKQEKHIREVKYAREIRQWDLKVEEAREDLMKATKTNTECMANLNRLLNEKRDLEHELNVRQKRMGKPFQDTQSRRDQQDIDNLQEVVRAQDEQAKALRTEIQLLSRKGGHILPPGPAPQPHRATHESRGRP